MAAIAQKNVIAQHPRHAPGIALAAYGSKQGRRQDWPSSDPVADIGGLQ